MKLVRCCMNIVLILCRPFLVFTKVKPNKITFVSLESTVLTEGFELISEQLEKKENYQIRYILIKFEKNLKGYFLYFFSCIRQFFAINTSKVVLLDYNNFVANGYVRDEVTVLQLWHATGAVKKFGNDTMRDYPLNGYDALIVNSEAFIPSFGSAFCMEQDKIYVTGIPQTDELFDQQKMLDYRNNLMAKFPQIAGKKVVLYAPTFRGKLLHGLEHMDIDLQSIANQLGEDYVILYKMHPLISNVHFENSERVIACNDIQIRELFAVTDILISDYSAIVFDFSVFEKTMIFYCPDLEEYESRVGIYFDYRAEMPGPICRTEADVIDAILKESYDVSRISQFKNKYFAYLDGKSTQRVVQLIDHFMET